MSNERTISRSARPGYSTRAARRDRGDEQAKAEAADWSDMNDRTPTRRWLRPLRLRTIERDSGERHASWLELFFDLVLVVAIAQLAHLFAHHPDLPSALITGGASAARWCPARAVRGST